MASYCGYPCEPSYCDYGTTTVYERDTVYVNGDATATEAETISLGAPFDNLAFAEDGTLYLSSFATGTITEVPPGGSPRTLTVGR